MKKIKQTMFSDDFLKGEQALAKAVLGIIKMGRGIGHIEILCQMVIMGDKEEIKKIQNETKN